VTGRGGGGAGDFLGIAYRRLWHFNSSTTFKALLWLSLLHTSYVTFTVVYIILKELIAIVCKRYSLQISKIHLDYYCVMQTITGLLGSS